MNLKLWSEIAVSHQGTRRDVFVRAEVAAGIRGAVLRLETLRES